MRKTLPLLPFVAFVSPSSAHFVSDHWEAHVSDVACFVGMESGIDHSVSEYKGQGYQLSVTAFFITAHDDAPHAYTHIPEVGTSKFVLQVQFIPGLSFRMERDTDLSDVRVEVEGKELPLVRDAESGDKSMPVYVLGGPEARRVWAEIFAERPLVFRFTLYDMENLEVRFSPDQIKVAAAMNEACVEEVRKVGY